MLGLCCLSISYSSLRGVLEHPEGRVVLAVVKDCIFPASSSSATEISYAVYPDSRLFLALKSRSLRLFNLKSFYPSPTLCISYVSDSFISTSFSSTTARFVIRTFYERTQMHKVAVYRTYCNLSVGKKQCQPLLKLEH